jgi:hypothetical protein
VYYELNFFFVEKFRCQRTIPARVSQAETDSNRTYFSRHAYLKVFHLDDHINQNTFSNFVKWFEQRARQNY